MKIVFEEKEKNVLLSIAKILREQKSKICNGMNCDFFNQCEGCPLNQITENLADIIDRIEILAGDEKNCTD